ncbi:chorismate mutase [Acidocella sp. KAb 2-4]|uniref:chorismate mutase n=1 Tax=Acidocella sp. KAb 2-4 TaxID=2885158 RepID=UPI001D087351|nr:chorismate mutase [Acidocella sp. KAb 2-4]MCB5945464.1 chorismate mutase [Acidocella sp. KAb 2-4]
MTQSLTPNTRLAELRAQLDALDDQIHDLLMQRAKVVESVATDGGKRGTKIRPGREASILRRLLARHGGALPRQAIVRIWREMFGAALIIEGGQTMAVCDGEGGETRLALAREHFGPLTPVRRHANPAQTMADLTREGGAQLGVLPPLAEDDEAHGGWWPLLTASGAQRLYVIAKIPFWTKRSEGLPVGDAYVVATVPPDASGDDRGLLALQFTADTSRARMMALVKDAGFEPGALWVRRLPGNTHLHALVEVAGLVEDADPRLAAIGGLEAPPVAIGGFAVPVDA